MQTALRNWIDTHANYLFHEFDWNFDKYIDNHPLPNNWKVEVAEQRGGEGQGDHFHVVLKFNCGADSVFAMLLGWYSSYEGSEYHEWKQVTPRERTITVYE